MIDDLQSLDGPCGDTNSCLSDYLNLPDLPDLTGSIDDALTIIPAGWGYTIDRSDGNIAVVELISEDGDSVTAEHSHTAIAVVIAALQAWGLQERI